MSTFPSGEVSNMRDSLVRAANTTPPRSKAVMRNVIIDLQDSSDPASRAIGQQAQAFIDQGKDQDAIRVVMNHLWGFNIMGGHRGTIRRKAYMRKGYTRKSGIHVKGASVHAALISDVGAPGKWKMGAPGIGKLKEGELKAVGYSATAKASTRHRALTKAIKLYGPLSTYRKLNAVAVYTKRTSPKVSKTFKTDRNWVGKHAGYKH